MRDLVHLDLFLDLPSSRPMVVERAIEFDCVGTEKVITLTSWPCRRAWLVGILAASPPKRGPYCTWSKNHFKKQMGAQDAVTQAGISALGYVQRKHVPRTLKRLEKNNYINTSLRHVPSSKQRRRVYELTPDGREAAALLRKRFLIQPLKLKVIPIP